MGSHRLGHPTPRLSLTPFRAGQTPTTSASEREGGVTSNGEENKVQILKQTGFNTVCAVTAQGERKGFSLCLPESAPSQENLPVWGWDSIDLDHVCCGMFFLLLFALYWKSFTLLKSSLNLH